MLNAKALEGLQVSILSEGDNEHLTEKRSFLAAGRCILRS